MSVQSTMIDFDNLEKLKQFTDKRIAEISAELGEVLRRVDMLHSTLEVKKKFFEALNIKAQEKPYEGINLGGDVILMVDPPADALVNLYESLSENLNKKLTAYRNLKNALSKIPSTSELQVSVSLVLENDIPKYIIIKTSK
ncbi:MAG: hypothetical protein ACP5HH_01510 [Fervidicoccaceae archaeon]